MLNSDIMSIFCDFVGTQYFASPSFAMSTTIYVCQRRKILRLYVSLGLPTYAQSPHSAEPPRVRRDETERETLRGRGDMSVSMFGILNKEMMSISLFFRDAKFCVPFFCHAHNRFMCARDAKFCVPFFLSFAQQIYVFQRRKILRLSVFICCSLCLQSLQLQ
jgi:hypothetical protein